MFPVISHIAYPDSYRYLFREYLGLSHNDDTVAWCLNFFKRYNGDIIEQSLKGFKEPSVPDIEVYVDQIIFAIVYAFNRKSIYRISQDHMKLFLDAFITTLSAVTVHELLHFYCIHNEVAIDDIIEEIAEYL